MGARALNGHNSAIFFLRVKFLGIKIMHFSRRIEWCKQLSSKTFSLKFHILDPIFAPRPTWALMDLWLQNHPGRLGTSPVYFPEPLSQKHVPKIFRPEPPPLKAHTASNICLVSTVLALVLATLSAAWASISFRRFLY